MIKYYCDCCNKEVEKLYVIEYLCHIGMENNLFEGYIDSEGNRISGREDCVSVCIKCYNEIMYTMYSKFRGLKNEKEISYSD